MMPVIKKAFDIMGDDEIKLSTENEALRNEIGSYNRKHLEESKS